MCIVYVYILKLSSYFGLVAANPDNWPSAYFVLEPLEFLLAYRLLKSDKISLKLIDLWKIEEKLLAFLG